MPVPKIQSRDPECPLRVNAGIVSGYSEKPHWDPLSDLALMGSQGNRQGGSRPEAGEWALEAPDAPWRESMRLCPPQGGFANPTGGLSASTALAAGLLVNHSSPREGFNINVVNGSAPDLFPAMYLVKKEFTLREGRSAAPLRPDRMSFHKSLKIMDLLSLMNRPIK
jgi:hypothetical protein